VPREAAAESADWHTSRPPGKTVSRSVTSEGTFMPEVTITFASRSCLAARGPGIRSLKPGYHRDRARLGRR
jgi:hypothetical protein